MVEDNPSLDDIITPLLTSNDVLLLIATIVMVVGLGFVISRLITFIPYFMGSILKKVKNKSIIYTNDTLETTNIDKSHLGYKDMFEKVTK